MIRHLAPPLNLGRFRVHSSTCRLRPSIRLASLAGRRLAVCCHRHLGKLRRVDRIAHQQKVLGGYSERDARRVSFPSIASLQHLNFAKTGSPFAGKKMVVIAVDLNYHIKHPSRRESLKHGFP